MRDSMESLNLPAGKASCFVSRLACTSLMLCGRVLSRCRPGSIIVIRFEHRPSLFHVGGNVVEVVHLRC